METNRSIYSKEICEKILDVLNTQLVTNFPFLGKVIYRLEYRLNEKVPQQFQEDQDRFSPVIFEEAGRREGPPLQVDGKTVYYNPVWLVDEYRKDTKSIGRLLLHCYLHCLYGHCFPQIEYDQEEWNLSCDLFVEATICRMNHPDYPTSEKNREWIVYLYLRKREFITMPRKPGKKINLDEAEIMALYELDKINLPNSAKLIYSALSNIYMDDLFMVQYKSDMYSELDPLLDNHELWYSSIVSLEEDPILLVDYTEDDNAVLEGEACVQKNFGEEPEESSDVENNSEEMGTPESDEEQAESSDVENNSEGLGTPKSDEEQAESSDVGSDYQGTETPESDEEQAESSDVENNSEGMGTPESDKEQAESSDVGSDYQGTETPESDEEQAESSDEESDSQETDQTVKPEEPPSGSLSRQQRKDLQEEWKQVANEVCQELEQNPDQYGEVVSGLLETLKTIVRTTYDYAAFLRRFMVLGEEMQVNLDEFDYTYYTYGLDLYGDIPLIEPLEFQEVYRIEEIAIVIDTSGSVSIDTVKAFLKSTYRILTKQAIFGKKFNLYMIQCDRVVHESVPITSQMEFKKYIEEFQLKGGGGTDFRPAFNHVQELIDKKTFHHLKGMLYFSDGWGIFPQKPTKYETVFVFLCDSDYRNEDVPYWVTKILLDSKEIYDLMTGEES